MVSSLLVTRDWPAQAQAEAPARAGVIVALHREGGDVDQLADLACPSGLRVVAAEAPRPIIPHNAAWGGPFEGYSWYPALGGQVQELTRFGHALCSLEELVIGLIDEAAGARPAIFLLGEGQGGALALTLARVAPDRLAGVIAVDAGLPETPGWTPPETDLAGLPILLAGGSPADAATAETLRRAGAVAETAVAGDRAGLQATIAAWLGAQR